MKTSKDKTIRAAAAPYYLSGAYLWRAPSGAPVSHFPLFGAGFRRAAASAYKYGVPGPPCKPRPFLSALAGLLLRGRAGLAPHKCGLKGTCSRPRSSGTTAPAASVADLAPGQLAGSPRRERGRRKGRKRGRRRRRRGAVSRPEEAGLPGVGVVNSSERERQRDWTERS